MGSFFWCEQFTHYPRTTFVSTVILAVTIVTLNVASWSNGNVHPCIVMMSFFAITGVFRNAFYKFFVHFWSCAAVATTITRFSGDDNRILISQAIGGENVGSR
jgi:hypothetical protein